MTRRFQFFLFLTFGLLTLMFSNVYSINKNYLNSLKSGVLLVGACKEVVDYESMPGDQKKILRIKYGARTFDSYIAAIVKQKKFCTLFKSRKPYHVYVRIDSGSSFLISNKGYLVTNYHVVTQYQNIVVHDGGPLAVTLRPAKIVWKSKEYDLAILKVNHLNPGRVPLSLANTSVINSLINEEVWSLGFTGASTKTIAKAESLEVKTDKGVVRSKPEDRYLGTNTPVTTIEHSAFIHFGNSGGPLVDYCGRVIGVNQGGPKKITGIGWAIHIKHLISALKLNNIRYKSSTKACDFYSGTSLLSRSLVIWLVVGMLLIIILMLVWLYRRSVIRPVGLTQFVRHEMSRYFKRSNQSTRNDKNVLNSTTETPQLVFATLKGVGNMSGSQLVLRGDGEIILGRADEAGLHVASDAVGRLHARLQWQHCSQSIWIEDLNSTNGTFLESRQRIWPGKKKLIKGSLGFYLAEPDNAFKIVFRE